MNRSDLLVSLYIFIVTDISTVYFKQLEATQKFLEKQKNKMTGFG